MEIKTDVLYNRDMSTVAKIVVLYQEKLKDYDKYKQLGLSLIVMRKNLVVAVR